MFDDHEVGRSGDNEYVLLTSDSRFGNRLYKGDATLVFVVIDLAFAAVFAHLVVRGLSQPSND